MMEVNSKTAKRKLSTSSITSECSTSSLTPPPRYDSHDEPESTNSNDNDLFSAAEALTQLTKSATPPLQISNPPSVTTSPFLPVDFKNDERKKTEYNTHQGEHPLVTKVSRVSRHPIVTNAVKYYESSKRNYGAFNYAAGIVEKAAIPVVNKIEVNLNNRYQARQLKLEGEDHTNPSLRVKKRRLGSAVDCNRVVTIETKKRLQFCLHLLRLANDRINYKVNFLQQKVINKERSIKEKRLHNNSIAIDDINDGRVDDEEEVTNADNETTNSPPQDAQSEAQQTKTEIIATVKKIIHVISTFKPSSLNPNTMSPDTDELISRSGLEDLEFKSTIRDIILKLPTKIQQAAITNNTSAQQANDRIFVFAKESLEMITRLTNVFNGQLENAEHWLAGEMQKERERQRGIESKQTTNQRLAIEQNGNEQNGNEQNGNEQNGNEFPRESSKRETSQTVVFQGETSQGEISPAGIVPGDTSQGETNHEATVRRVESELTDK